MNLNLFNRELNLQETLPRHSGNCNEHTIRRWSETFSAGDTHLDN